VSEGYIDAPGATHHVLEPLEALADRRRVIFYDQLSCGKSDCPEHPELQSLILCRSPASMLRWTADCKELLEQLPAEVAKVIHEHQAAGFTTCPEYVAATMSFYREHMCRLNPWPVGLERR